MGPEARLEQACVRLAKKHGWISVKVCAEPGFPDRVFIGPARGRVVFVEFKSPLGTVTRKQAKCLTELFGRGHQTAVVRTIEKFRVALSLKP